METSIKISLKFLQRTFLGGVRGGQAPPSTPLAGLASPLELYILVLSIYYDFPRSNGEFKYIIEFNSIKNYILK